MSGVKRYTESCMEGGGVVPDCDGELVDWSAYAACESRLHDVAVACANAEQERDELRAQVEAMRTAIDAVMTMDVRGHQLQDRLQFSTRGRDILNKVNAALQAKP